MIVTSIGRALGRGNIVGLSERGAKGSYAAASRVDSPRVEDYLLSSANVTTERAQRHDPRTVRRVHDCRVDFNDVSEESFRNYLLGQCRPRRGRGIELLASNTDKCEPLVRTSAPTRFHISDERTQSRNIRIYLGPYDPLSTLLSLQLTSALSTRPREASFPSLIFRVSRTHVDGSLRNQDLSLRIQIC